MARTRKGWDALSDAYRARLSRQGVSRSAYESGVSLSKARGHTSAPEESFAKRIRRFIAGHDAPADPKAEFQRIKALGPERGQAYMDYRRTMVRLYEGGDYPDAERMWHKRDVSIRNIVEYRRRDGRVEDGTWWYHGMFGG